MKGTTLKSKISVLSHSKINTITMFDGIQECNESTIDDISQLKDEIGF